MAKTRRRSATATLGWGVAFALAVCGLYAGARFGQRTYRHSQDEQTKAEALKRARHAVETGRHLLGRGDVEGAAREYLTAYENGLEDTGVRLMLPWLRDRLELEVARLVHGKEVLSLAFSSDGKRALSGSSDKSARIFELPSGRLLHKLVGHDGPVLAVSWSSDGTRVLTLGGDSTCRLWDSARGSAVATLKEPAHEGKAPWLCRFSPDGTRVITIVADKSPTLWNSQDGRLVGTLSGHGGQVLLANFAPDGQHLVTVAGVSAYLWQATSGRLVSALRGHLENVKDATFSPDSSRVVTTSADQTGRLWDGRSGQFLVSLEGHTGTVYSATYTLAGGKAIMTVSADGTARLWNSLTGQPMFLPVSHPRHSQILLVSKDGGRMVTRSESGSLELWDRILGHNRGTLSIGEKSDGHGDRGSTTSGSDGEVAAAFSPNGRRIVTGGLDGVLRLWDGRSGQPLLSWKGHTGRVRAVAYSPDGSSFLTGSSDGTARLWQGGTDRFPRPLDGHQTSVTSVAFSPDGQRLLSASRDGTVRTWDPATGSEVLSLEGPRRAIDRAFFTSDGHFIVTVISGDTRGLSGRTPCLVRVLDATSGEQRALFGDQLDLGRALAVSPNGRRVVTASSLESRAQLHDLTVTPPRLVASLEGHKSSISAAAWSSDSKLLATASEDHTVRLWDGQSGQLLRQLDGPSEPVQSVAFSFDGRQLVSGAADRTARLYDTATAARLGSLSGQIGTVSDVRFSPDGERVLTIDAGERAWLWSSREARLVAALSIYSANNRGHNATAFSPDSSRVVGAGEELRIYDGKSGLSLLNLDSTIGDHVEVFTAAGWSPDGRLLATGTRTGALKLWDVHLESRPAAVVADELRPLLARSALRTESN
jgi:WD40 repeat protein